MVSGHGRTLQRIGGAGAWRGTVLVLFLILGIGQLGPIHLQIVLSWAVQTLLYVVLLGQVVLLARDPALPASARRFWSTVRITCAMSIFTDGVPFVISLRSHGEGGAVPGIVHDISGALAVLVLVFACLTYRGTGHGQGRQLRRWLDVATLMIAGLGAVWYFEAGPLAGEHVGVANVVLTIVLDAVAIVTVLAFLQPLAFDVRPMVRRTGLLGVAAVIVGVLTEAALPPALGTPWLRLILVLRTGAATLAILAVRHQRATLQEPSKPARQSRHIYSRLPYAAVAVTYGLMGGALGLDQAGSRAWGLFAAATGVTALVVVRQMTAMTDNARLVRDLTASVERADELAAELHHHAFYDDLTGLPNRMLFGDRLDHALVTRRRTEANVAVMVVDLDDFKLVNDRFGHAEGDRVLREAAKRLMLSLRAGDTVARLGGDEFAILVHGADDEAVRIVAGRVVDAFAAPFVVQDHVTELGVSVGVATTLLVGENRDAATLLRHADIAMYVAKAAGRRRYEIFLPAMLDKLVTRHDTKQALTRAITEHELVVHYQPIVDAVDGQVRGVEALVRWLRPGHGLVPPLEFLSLAETVGLIPDIDLFVLGQSCQQVSGWNAHRAPAAQLSVHVNMSAVTLSSPDVVSQVAAALQDSGLPPHRLTVELTESTLMSDPPAIIARMHALKQTGVRLAIDDFGTGYSSLAYLRDLPVDTVKVDKSFVDRIVGEEIDRELVRTIVTLAGRLGLDTVAEGVEGLEQAALLSALGCSRMQGFLFARPMPADQLEETGDQVGRDASWLGHAALESMPVVAVPAPR